MNQYVNMGIVEFGEAITNGSMTAVEVLPILDARIAKRAATGKKPIAKIVAYRNELAASINATTGAGIPAMPVPNYATAAQPTASLPNDAECLIQQIKAVVPTAELPAFIARLATI